MHRTHTAVSGRVRKHPGLQSPAAPPRPAPRPEGRRSDEATRLSVPRCRPQMVFSASQVTIVEKADCSSVLPSPLSISTKSKMTFLFANLKDRDFLVERISDFLQKMPSKPSGGSQAERKASVVDAAPEVSEPRRAAEWGQGQEESPWVERAPTWRCWKTSPSPSLRGPGHAHRAQGLRPLWTPRLPQVGLPASSLTPHEKPPLPGPAPFISVPHELILH